MDRLRPSDDPPTIVDDAWDLPPVDVIAYDLPASDILADIASQAGVSVVVPQDARDHLITLEITGRPAQDAFIAIGEDLGLIARHREGLVSYVDPDDATYQSVVVRTGYEDPAQVTQAVQDVAGTRAKTKLVGDRVVVVGPADSLRRAVEFQRRLEYGPDGWLIEVRVVRVSRSFRQTVGLDWDIGGSLVVHGDSGVGNLSGSIPVMGAGASFLAQVIAQADLGGDEAHLLNNSTLFVLEGQAARIQQGDVIPVPQRTVSDAGTVTVSGYEYIETGFTLDASAKRVPAGVLLTLTPELSSVTGFVDGAPITTQSSVTSSVVVNSGDWIILSGLDASLLTRRLDGLPGVGVKPPFGLKDETAEDDSLLVLVRATRVFASGVSQSSESQPPATGGGGG